MCLVVDDNLTNSLSNEHYIEVYNKPTVMAYVSILLFGPNTKLKVFKNIAKLNRM